MLSDLILKFIFSFEFIIYFNLIMLSSVPNFSHTFPSFSTQFHALFSFLTKKNKNYNKNKLKKNYSSNTNISK